MKISVVRHGKTQWNIDRLLQGRTDTDLALEGIEDARAMAKVLGKNTIHQLLVSPLKRTQQTASIINEVLDCPISLDERLIERDFGLCQGMTIDEYHHASREYTSTIEPLSHLNQRIEEVVSELLEMDVPHICIVTHGGILKQTFHHYRLFPDIEWVKHRCIYTIEVENKQVMKTGILDLNPISQ